jgi:hypothetical protein
MKHDEILASVAVLILAGVLVYLTRIGVLTIGLAAHRSDSIAANQAIAGNEIAASGGDPGSLIYGPAIYVANTPWPFGSGAGNVIPPTSAGNTLPGAISADFLGMEVS